MTTNRPLEDPISKWLEADAPTQLPDRVLRATFERTRRSRQQGGWRALLGSIHLNRFASVLGGAAVVVVAAGLALNFLANQLGVGRSIPATDPRSPFLGVWISTTDSDGGTQTMTIRASADGAVEIVVLDDVATVCAATSSTMTGTGRLRGTDALVIPTPDYTCDDGSEPQAQSGPPLAEQLRDLTFVRDAKTETLTDNFGGVWLREGAEPLASGGMWPQNTLDEVRAAQKRADAGDPDYTWQIGARLVEEDPNNQVEAELIDRFLREVLGWEAYLFYAGGTFSDWAGAGMNGWVEGTVTGQGYLRCAPGRTNPLYPDESCAPTLDDLRYETVSLDLAQLDHQGRDGIWVVTGWRSTAPFVQTDPDVAEADARRRIEAFLDARVVGSGAEGDVVVPTRDVVPLLYATTSGAPYERYEVERVAGPDWPDGRMTFTVRLVANGGATVVEQEVSADQGNPLWVHADSTTENGQPILLSWSSPDGAVSVSAPATWTAWLSGKEGSDYVHDVWFGTLWRVGEFNFSGDRVEFVDPVAFDAWCGAQGGSPLLSAPASAAAIVQQVIADPSFETTAPVAARVGGLEAVSIDVTLAPGGVRCGPFGIEISRWVHSVGPGERLRLYLIDLPAGMPVKTLAITVVATEERFDDVIAETAPIIESIEFHPG